MMSLIKISIRQINGYKSKYVFIFIIITLGFTVITVMTGLTDSMRTSVTKAAKIHYGGELFITGADKQAGTMLVVDDVEKIKKIINTSNIDIKKEYLRTNVINTGFIYFNGMGIRHKNIYGIDFDKESEDFKILNIAGSIPQNSKGILISKITSDKLKVHLGDAVTIKVITRTGQINTGQFIVDGIINDSGIFGAYRCFMDRKELNKLLNIETYKYSSVGIYLNDIDKTDKYANELYINLSKELQTNKEILTKNDLTFGFSRDWKGVKYFVFPLSVYISQVSDLLLAMDLISYLLYIMISTIIIISVYVSFNVLLQDRIVEFSSMRAIGMQKRDLKFMIVTESICLLIVSFISSFIFSFLIFFIISKVHFDFIPGFDFFLINGKLLPEIRIYRVIINICILLFSVIPAAYVPSYQISKTFIADGLIER